MEPILFIFSKKLPFYFDRIEDNITKIRVKCIDFGRFRTTTSKSTIGHLDERHSDSDFPAQSIDLCFLRIAPWNRHGWDVRDGEFIANLLKGTTRMEKYGNGHFELVVQFKIEGKLLFAFDMFVVDDSSGQNQHYRELITQKGIAFNTLNGLKEMFSHARAMDALNEGQLNWINAFLV